MPAAFTAIQQELDTVRHHWWRVGLFQRLAGVAILLPALALLTTATLGYWVDQPPAWLRWTTSLASGAAGGVALIYLLTGLGRTLRPAQAARLVEASYPFLGNGPINAVLLAAGDRHDELVDRAMQETAAQLHPLDLRSTVATQRLRNRARVALILWVAALLLFVLQPVPMRRALAMLFRPSQYARHYHDLTISHLSPGDATIYIGQPVTIRIAMGDETPDTYGEVSLVIAGRDEPIPMPYQPGLGHELKLGPVAEPMQYAIRVGRRHYPQDRPWYTISVMDRWDLDRFAATITYATYTGRPVETIEDFTGSLALPDGSRIAVHTRLTPTPPGLFLESPLTPSLLPLEDTDGEFIASMVAAGEPIVYRLVATDSDGRRLHTLPTPTPSDPEPWFTITPVPDTPPALAVLSPGPEIALAPDESLTLKVRAVDDHGLESLTIYAATDGEPLAPINTLALDNATSTTLQLPFDMAALQPLHPSQEVRYVIAVTDSRDLGDLGPQETRSAEYRITIDAPEALAQQRVEQARQLIEHIEALLAFQAMLRVETQRCATLITDLEALHSEATQLVAGQQALAGKFEDLVETFPFSSEQLAIRQALEQLALGPAPEAIIHARRLRSIDRIEDRMRPCNDLATEQDTIIRKLQTLLAVTLNDERDATAGQNGVPGDDETDPEEFRQAVESFVEAQSELVDAANALAEKASDGIGADDVEALRDVQARQDDMAQLLEELTDQARSLPDQELNTDAILQELLSIETDVTMAANALAKDAVPVAAGLERNILAKADNLESDLEKWLADTPDRMGISMDPTDDLDTVEPGDLPDALEDLIGDLLEQEEDLFDAIEDETSAAASNSREGIGWETADGPISSMTGEGVTGNVLPNANEIAGRGGDGRSGQASGEFIEDSAEGAEGRRTGTRLTDDPIQDGTINDTDPGPAGGATGGGRLSGAGSAGLEGPTPDQMERLDELLDQQAMLIDQARQIDDLATDDFVRLQMLDAIALMKAVQNDLNRYGYRNALRHRDATLGAISQAHIAITGASIVLDTSQGPAEADNLDIHMIDEAELPDAHRQQLRAYYRKLSQQDGEP